MSNNSSPSNFEFTHVNAEDEECESFEGIVGRSHAIRRVVRLVEIVSTANSTVLLLGETGTGKEMVAQAIHRRSIRHRKHFVKLNCAAIPSGLLESELFGHERGAFTGAITQKIGRVEVADQGSLFLDEIGDIPFELQPKLLRMLQEREFERLGCNRTRKVDIRVIAATHRDLESMVQDQQFRSDLYYRLNVFPIVIPPLRDRREDIPLLVRHFLRVIGRELNKDIACVTPESMEWLVQHNWPGNIRELENVIERAAILTQSRTLRISSSDLRSRINPRGSSPTLQTLADVERAHILAVLRDTEWTLSGPEGAARRLGMNRSTLAFRMKKLGIVRPWQLSSNRDTL